jgi:predicted transcriptional regulator
MQQTDLLRKQVKKYIDEADDKTVQMVYALLEVEHQYDFWDELPDEVKTDIDEAIKQADAGELISHEEVMKKYQKWLTK